MQVLEIVNLPQLNLFIVAATVLALSPGPGVFYVLARTINGGKGEGIASTLGTSIGGLIHIILAAIGLTAVIAASAHALGIIKLVGVAYLIFLGTRLILSARNSSPNLNVKATGNRRAFLEGILTEALNVKTALFFLAFLPQFIYPNLSILGQVIIYGLISVALNTLVDFIVVFSTSRLLSIMKSNNQPTVLLSYASGSILLALGVYLGTLDLHK